MFPRGQPLPDACRVLHVVTSVCAGGLSRYLLNLLRHLDPNCVESHLICTHFEGPHFGEATPWVRSSEVLSARGQAEKLARLRSAIGKLRPDVLQAHQEPVGLIAGKWAGVARRVDTLHMADYWLTDGHPILRWASRACATEYLVYTDHEAGKLTGVVPKQRIRVLEAGHDAGAAIDYFPAAEVRREHGISEDALVIGAISRLDPEKGVRYLVEAAPAVLAECPAAHFLLIGDGAEREALERRVAELGVAKRVTFAGYRPEGARYLEVMDVFVLPSLSESWGFAVLEAMTAGKAIVATDAAGPAAILEDGRTALLTPRGQSAGLAAAIGRLATDADTRRRLGEAAARQVRERHSMERFVREYERFYGVGRSGA